MPELDRFVFDWTPSGLVWLFVFELVVLATMLVFRQIGRMLGRDDPHDFFVVFYRVFWEAMRKPSLHPTPVNYEPVPPKRETTADAATAGEALDDDALDSLFRGGDDDEDDDAPAAADDDQDDELGNEITLVCTGPANETRVVGVGASSITIEVEVDPESGLANAAVLQATSLALNVPRQLVAIVSGQTRAEKLIRVNVPPADLARRMAAAAGAVQPATRPRPAATPPDDDDAWGDMGDSVAFRDS